MVVIDCWQIIFENCHKNIEKWTRFRLLFAKLARKIGKFCRSTFHFECEKYTNFRTWSDEETTAFLKCYEGRKLEFLHTRKKVFAYENVLADLMFLNV